MKSKFILLLIVIFQGNIECRVDWNAKEEEHKDNNVVVTRRKGFYSGLEKLQNDNDFEHFKCDSNTECVGAYNKQREPQSTINPKTRKQERQYSSKENFGAFRSENTFDDVKRRKNYGKTTSSVFGLPEDQRRSTHFDFGNGPFENSMRRKQDHFHHYDDSYLSYQFNDHGKNSETSKVAFPGYKVIETPPNKVQQQLIDQNYEKYNKPKNFLINNDKMRMIQNQTSGKRFQPSKNLVDNAQCGLDNPRRIIGGTNTDIDEFPWLVLLQYWDGGNISHDCGGVLISKRHVLTAAHCTNGTSVSNKRKQLRKVRLGEWDLSTDEDCQGNVCSSPVQDIRIKEVVPHEGYGSRDKSQVHDIAIIKLETEATLNRAYLKASGAVIDYDDILLISEYVQPICLPFEDVGTQDYEGKRLTVSGWGRTSNTRNSASNVKKKVDLPVVDWNECSRFYRSYFGGLKIFKSQFCAGGEPGEDSCQGDSGGPLMTVQRKNNEVHWHLIGIVSSGPAACGVEDRPSLYTNVSQYTDWIIKNTNN